MEKIKLLAIAITLIAVSGCKDEDREVKTDLVNRPDVAVDYIVQTLNAKTVAEATIIDLHDRDGNIMFPIPAMMQEAITHGRTIDVLQRKMDFEVHDVIETFHYFEDMKDFETDSGYLYTSYEALDMAEQLTFVGYGEENKNTWRIKSFTSFETHRAVRDFFVNLIGVDGRPLFTIKEASVPTNVFVFALIMRYAEAAFEANEDTVDFDALILEELELYKEIYDPVSKGTSNYSQWSGYRILAKDQAVWLIMGARLSEEGSKARNGNANEMLSEFEKYTVIKIARLAATAKLEMSQIKEGTEEFKAAMKLVVKRAERTSYLLQQAIERGETPAEIAVTVPSATPKQIMVEYFKAKKDKQPARLYTDLQASTWTDKLFGVGLTLPRYEDTNEIFMVLLNRAGNNPALDNKGVAQITDILVTQILGKGLDATTVNGELETLEGAFEKANEVALAAEKAASTPLYTANQAIWVALAVVVDKTEVSTMIDADKALDAGPLDDKIPEIKARLIKLLNPAS